MNKKIFYENNKKSSGKSGRITKIFGVFTVFMLTFIIILTFAGCKDRATKTQESVESAETTAAEESRNPDSLSSESEETKSSSSNEKETTTTTEIATGKLEETTQVQESVTETTGQIPDEITNLINEANSYYSSWEYGLAKNAYRKAELVINDSELSEQAKKDLINSFYSNYKKSKDIIEAARVHFANAMQLEYETRYEEAKAELEAALAIYQKYADALEAYENLKILMGLE